jgi:hypothetical protein
MAKFKFGQAVRNIHASEDNPIRDGLFVREFMQHGRTNPGWTCEVTDGKGKFWKTFSKYLIALTGEGS